MYKTLTAICFMLCLGSMLAPDNGRAQTGDNEIGLYTDPSGDPAAVNVDAIPFELFEIYVVLTNPVNYNFNGLGISRPVTLVGGWEAKIVTPPNFIIMNTLLPVGAINVGIYPTYFIGYKYPVPIIGNAGTLMTLEGMITDTAPNEFYLGVSVPSDFPDSMAYLDSEDSLYEYPYSLVAAWPSSGSFDAPVFSVNNPGAVVATENESWGDLKALYR